jgi:hypothetical protein
MTEMQTEVRRGVVLAAVQRAMFCALTGRCLDIDDAVLVTARDGSRASILTGDAWRGLARDLADVADVIEVWTGAGDELVSDGKAWAVAP